MKVFIAAWKQNGSFFPSFNLLFIRLWFLFFFIFHYFFLFLFSVLFIQFFAYFYNYFLAPLFAKFFFFVLFTFPPVPTGSSFIIQALLQYYGNITIKTFSQDTPCWKSSVILLAGVSFECAGRHAGLLWQHA